jgi:hypothetical protein
VEVNLREAIRWWTLAAEKDFKGYTKDPVAKMSLYLTLGETHFELTLIDDPRLIDPETVEEDHAVGIHYFRQALRLEPANNKSSVIKRINRALGNRHSIPRPRPKPKQGDFDGKVHPHGRIYRLEGRER